MRWKYILKQIYNQLYEKTMFRYKYSQQIKRQEKIASSPKIEDIHFDVMIYGEENIMNIPHKLKKSLKNQIYGNWKWYSSDNREGELEYVVIVEKNSMLSPYTFVKAVEVIQTKGRVEVIYSDEDRYSSSTNLFFEPKFKPDFDLELLRSTNYIGGFLILKRSLYEKVNRKIGQCKKATMYEFLLRTIEETENIYHISQVLYHKIGKNKINAEFEKKALEEHYKRCKIIAKVNSTKVLGVYSTKYILQDKPLVSIIIPNKDSLEILKRCVESICNKTQYNNYEILIIENNSTDKNTFLYYQELAMDKRIRVVVYEGIFNYSQINNFATLHARGDYYLFLNNDTEVITCDWLERMIGDCQRKKVAVVGAKLYYPNNVIQHAGIIVGYRNAAAHAFINCAENEKGYCNRCICKQNYLAVTGACMLVKAEVFNKMEGFDEKLAVAYNDVDLCINMYNEGYLITFDPDVKLYHYESYSRGKDEMSEEKRQRLEKERVRLSKKWSKFFDNGDPYYNPNLTLENTIFTVEI